MTDFSTSSELQVSVSQRSLSRAQSTIQQELGGVTVDVNASTAGSSITGAVGGGARTDGGREFLGELTELGRESLDVERSILEEIKKTATMTGGEGGGGGGGLLGIGLMSRLPSLAGGVGAGSLISGTISAGSLVTGAVAASGLISGAVVINELVTGDVQATDFVTGSIKAGELLTGGLSPNDFVSGTIGVASLIGGSVAMASYVTGSVGIAGFITGSVGAGGLISGSIGAGTIITGAVGAGALITGTIAAGALVVGTIAISDYVAGKLAASDLLEDNRSKKSSEISKGYEPGEGNNPPANPSLAGSPSVLDPASPWHGQEQPDIDWSDPGGTVNSTSGSGGVNPGDFNVTVEMPEVNGPNVPTEPPDNSSSTNKAAKNRGNTTVNATAEATVEGTSPREAERIAEEKAEEMADELRREFTGGL